MTHIISSAVWLHGEIGLTCCCDLTVKVNRWCMSTSRSLWRHWFVGESMPQDIKQLVRATVRRIKVTVLPEVCCRLFEKKQKQKLCRVIVVAEKDFFIQCLGRRYNTISYKKTTTKKQHIHRFSKISSTQLNIQSKATAYTVSLNFIAFHIPQHQWQQSRQHRLVATNHFQLTCWQGLTKWFNKGENYLYF